MPQATKVQVQHTVGDVVYLPPIDDQPGTMGVVKRINKDGSIRVETDEPDQDGRTLQDCEPKDVKTPTPKQLSARTAHLAQQEKTVQTTTKKPKLATKAQRAAHKAKDEDLPPKKSKKATPAASAKRATREQISTRLALGTTERTSLEQSVGNQCLHCLAVAKVKGTPEAKTAKRLAETGKAPESALRALRDVLREHQPEPEDNEVEWVLTQRACRGIGMVIARAAAGDDEGEE